MKSLLPVILIFLVSLTCKGQKYDNPPCSADTVLIQTDWTNYYLNHKIKPYRAVLCEKRSGLGFRLEIGASGYNYNSATKNWLGNHGGPNFNFILSIRNVNLGFRFKPWTVKPQQELVFGNQLLTSKADLNPVKLDYYIGYSFDFSKLYSLEPYVGYSRTVFKVINEEELGIKYFIPEAQGFITGLTINKYFKLKEFKYIAVFLTMGYSTTNYKKINEKLGRGYTEGTLGVAYKGFFYRKFYKKVKERNQV